MCQKSGVSLCWSSQGFSALHYRLCFLQCDWRRENSLQKVINVNEALRDQLCITRPSSLIGGIWACMKLTWRLLNFATMSALCIALQVSESSHVSSTKCYCQLFSPYASDHYLSYELALNVSHQNMHKTMNDANVGFSWIIRVHLWCSLPLWSLLFSVLLQNFVICPFFRMLYTEKKLC